MRQLLLISVFFLTVLFLGGCRADRAPGITAREFSEILDSSMSPDNLPLERIPEIDPYESYFLSLKAAEYDYIEAALLLARHCRGNTEGFIRERAAEILISLNMEIGDYPEAGFQASLSAAEYPDNYFFRRSAAESKYWQHHDQAVLDSVEELMKLPESEGDYELYLFRAVSAYRLNRTNWRDYWVELFYEVPASEYLRRGWDYLGFDFEKPAGEFPGLEKLMEGKYQLSIGSYRDAADNLAVFAENSSAGSLTAAVVADIENSFLRSGMKSAGAEILEALGVQPGGRSSLFAAARLYRKAGRYRDADRCMDRLISETAAAALTERELWYSFDVKVRRNLGSAVDSFEFYAENWDNPEYFADTLDSLCTALIRRRRWDDISKLALRLEQTGPDSSYSRYRYITERAAELRLTDTIIFTRPAADMYYRILSGDALNEIRAVRTGSEDGRVFDGPAERYIEGLLRYDLDDYVLDEIRKYSGSLSEEFFAHCARLSTERGYNLDSIRIMYQYPGELTAAGLAALYPALYRRDIESAADENSIPVQLLFGVVWKESGFEKDIVSRSGAVGLSQLMPSTAEDVARRTRRKDGDLTDPAENLFLGSWYMNWLTGYVGNTAAAVLSYNGGPGRVKGWIREYSDFPLDLVYEIVPVAETHQYGKKVLTAAVLYGLIYYGIEPEQTLSLFF